MGVDTRSFTFKSRYYDTTKRITGRALQKRRLSVWTKDPCCAVCRRLTAFPRGFELDHVVPLFPPGDGLVLPLGVKELGVGGFRVAFVGGDQLAALCLVWILGVVDAVGQAVGNRLALINVHGNDACGRHGRGLLSVRRICNFFLNNAPLRL